MQVFFGIAYFIVGTAQLFAIVDGVGYALNTGRVFSFIVAFFVTYIPLLGSSLGVYGAVNVWDWSFLQAIVLFFWYIPVVLVLALAGAFSGR